MKGDCDNDKENEFISALKSSKLTTRELINSWSFSSPDSANTDNIAMSLTLIDLPNFTQTTTTDDDTRVDEYSLENEQTNLLPDHYHLENEREANEEQQNNIFTNLELFSTCPISVQTKCETLKQVLKPVSIILAKFLN